MDPADFAHFDADGARQFLAELPTETRKRGSQLFESSAVKELRCVVHGMEFVADIEGDTLLQTTLRYDPETKSWWEECTCPPGGGCEHAAAAMQLLLAEQQSATSVLTGAKRIKRKPEPPSLASGVLARKATELLGRELSRPEADFVRRVEDRFARLKERPSVTGDDLLLFGLKFSGSNSWEKLDLYPTPPKDEIEFWLYVALAAEDRGIAWPEFLRPLTQLDEVRERVSRWKRMRDVERWRALLNNLQLTPIDEIRAPDEIELRLRFTPTEAVFEFRKSGALDFTTIKPGRFKDFDEKNCEQLSPDVSLLWQPISQRARHGHPINLVYEDPQTRRLLNRFLRHQSLQPFIVGLDGEPLTRPTEPLRWDLAPAGDELDDYRLRLVQPGGSPAPKALVVLSGRPTLYLTGNTLWTSPPIEDRAVDPSVETPVPAPALETAAGIRFLQHHGIPLPPRLADKVRTVSLRPVLNGELRAIAFGNETEYAVLDALGISVEGSYAERWNGTAWLDAKLAASAEGDLQKSGEPGEESLVTYDRSQLAEIPRVLESAGFKWDFARQRWLLRVTAKFPDLFMAWIQALPTSVGLELRGELASFQNATVAGKVRLELTEAGMDWFDLKVVLDVTDTQLSSEEIKLLLDARGKWVRLGKKGWRKLEFKLSSEEDIQFAKLGINPHELTSEPQRLHALQLSDSAAKALVGDEKYAVIQRRVAEIQARVTPSLPETLKATLRPYQLEGYHFLCYLAANRFGGILADDMGLGKTLQTLGWIAWLHQERPKNELPKSIETVAATVEESSTTALKGKRRKPTLEVIAGPAPFLVVCPKSVTDNWRAEAERFVPELRVKVWPSDSVKDLPSLAASADLHVINYNQLRIVGESLTKVEFHTVVLDEGQYIKNPASITAQLARNLRAQHRLVLSGTPIENKLLDLWSLMNFAMPGALGSRAEFQKLFDQKGDSLARQRLAARVRPFLLRRTKAQVARDLPDRIEEDLFCELEGEQKTLYRAELKRAQGMLLRVNSPAALNKHRFNFLTSLLRLRQICCHPRLTKPDSKAESAKVEALMETLEPLMEEGQRVLVFSQFVEMLELLKSAIAERGWTTYFLVGGTERRGDLVRQFQADTGAAIFLISLKAGGFGLNLTAASYVVLFDPWWNPAVEAQAIDRSHRIGQTQKVIAYRLLIKDSVEEKIRSLQRQKSQLALDVLGEEKFSQSLSLEDLRFLLSD
jgi:hypothetical protein